MFISCIKATFTMPHKVVLIISLMHCILQCSVSEYSRCGNRCCSNYREEEGKCVECIGSWGINCSASCKENFYGRSCREQCYCEADERCHPMYGCCTKTDQTCQQKDGSGQIQGNTTDTQAGNDEDSSTSPITRIILSLCVIIILLSCAISYYIWTREKRLTPKGEPESVNICEEDNASVGHVNEYCYDDIRESQMILDENCRDVQEIRYSDHLCRHQTTSSGHCQICEMAKQGSENETGDYCKLAEGNGYNVLSLHTARGDVAVSCDEACVDENHYSLPEETLKKKEGNDKGTTDNGKNVYHMYHILKKSVNETGNRKPEVEIQQKDSV